jgi:hypothetical protein
MARIGFKDMPVVRARHEVHSCRLASGENKEKLRSSRQYFQHRSSFPLRAAPLTRSPTPVIIPPSALGRNSLRPWPNRLIPLPSWSAAA